MDELRNQLKSQNLSTVPPTAFGEVGGRVFPDNPSIADVNDLIQIVKGWRAVHLPSLGSPISKSATITSQTGNGDILQPTNAQVMRVGSFCVFYGVPCLGQRLKPISLRRQINIGNGFD